MPDIFETLDSISLTAPKTVTIDGNTIELSKEAEKQLRESYTALLSKDLEQKKALVKTILSQTVKECRDKEAKVKDVLQTSFPIPDLDYLINNRIVFGSKNGDGETILRFILPFRYAPLSVDKKRIRYPKQLERAIKVIIDLSGTTDKRVKSVELVNRDLSKFEHYHNFTSGDCLGELEDKNRVIANFADLLRFRDEVQVLYSDIHVEADGDRNHKYPAGLPELFSIKTADETVTWRPGQVRVRQGPSVIAGSVAVANQGQGAVWHVEPTRQAERTRHPRPFAFLFGDPTSIALTVTLLSVLAVVVGGVTYAFLRTPDSSVSTDSVPAAIVSVTPTSNRSGWVVSGNEATVSGTMGSISADKGVTTVNFTNGAAFSMATVGYYDKLAKPLVIGNSYIIRLYGVPSGDSIKFHSFIDVSPMPGSTPVHPEIPGYKWVGEDVSLVPGSTPVVGPTLTTVPSPTPDTAQDVTHTETTDIPLLPTREGPGILLLVGVVGVAIFMTVRLCRL